MNLYVPGTTSASEWISERFSILAEIVQEYDSNLELRWIPSDKRTRDDKKPYVIIDKRGDIPIHYASELDNPEEILAKIFWADATKHDILSRLEATEAAHQVFVMKEWLNRMEEAADEAHFFMKSPLNSITFNGKKFDDQRRYVGPAKDRKHL